jgi:hypothetical protein
MPLSTSATGGWLVFTSSRNTDISNRLYSPLKRIIWAASYWFGLWRCWGFDILALNTAGCKFILLIDDNLFHEHMNLNFTVLRFSLKYEKLSILFTKVPGGIWPVSARFLLAFFATNLIWYLRQRKTIVLPLTDFDDAGFFGHEVTETGSQCLGSEHIVMG